MIVRIPHRPTGGVSSCFFAIRPVDSPHMSVRPFAPRIIFHYLKQNSILLSLLAILLSVLFVSEQVISRETFLS